MKLKMLLLSIVTLAALVVLAGVAPAPYRSIGTALVVGPVLLNGHRMSGPSLALSDGDRLETGARGGAIVTLSKSDAMTLSENSAVKLTARDNGVAAELDHGRVLVSSSTSGCANCAWPGKRSRSALRRAGRANTRCRVFRAPLTCWPGPGT